jgi:hypothetical protein
MEKLSSPITLIKQSFDVFFDKVNLVSFLKIYVWILPFQIFFLYQNYFIDSQSKILNTTNVQQIILTYPWFLVLTVVINLLFLVVSFWIDASGVKAILDITGKKKITVPGIFKYTRKILWPFSLLSILLGLIQLGGMVLLILPGVVFSVWFGFAKFVFMSKNMSPIESLKVSKALVSGKFWPVLGRMAVFVVFGLVFQMVFSLIPYRLGPIVAQLFGALLILPYYFLYKEVSSPR